MASYGVVKDIRELKRLASPVPKPQSLAWDGAKLWMGSLATRRIYALDPATLAIRWECVAPGTPYGLTVVDGGELRVLCSETADDHRIIRSCIPRMGFDDTFGLPCPDDTGSQLGYDGQWLHVSQWYSKKVVRLGRDGGVERVISAPRGICGQVFVDGDLFLITTDAEETNDYFLTRIDVRADTPRIEDVARVPFQARALAFDGTHFWSNHREQNQIVCFAHPGR